MGPPAACLLMIQRVSLATNRQVTPDHPRGFNCCWVSVVHPSVGLHICTSMLSVSYSPVFTWSCSLPLCLPWSHTLPDSSALLCGSAQLWFQGLAELLGQVFQLGFKVSYLNTLSDSPRICIWPRPCTKASLTHLGLCSNLFNVL